jgi:hypothetical protein
VPTLAEIGPFRLFFYSNEGTEPPHIYVQRERKIAKFWLESVALASSGAVFRFRTPVDRAYRFGESGAVSGGMA